MTDCYHSYEFVDRTFDYSVVWYECVYCRHVKKEERRVFKFSHKDSIKQAKIELGIISEDRER